MLRDAIDRYQRRPPIGARFQIKLGSEGYPPDLDTLVTGVDVAGKKLKFLRKISRRSHDQQQEWGMRSPCRMTKTQLPGWAKRVRCLHQVGPNRFGRHEVQGLVDEKQVQSPQFQSM